MRNQKILNALEKFMLDGYKQVSLSELLHATGTNKKKTLRKLKTLGLYMRFNGNEVYILLDNSRAYSCVLKLPESKLSEVLG